jgi:hypothetical protein
MSPIMRMVAIRHLESGNLDKAAECMVLHFLANKKYYYGLL